MILYGSSISPFVRKVLVFATEQGAPIELKPVGLGSEDPDFLRASPFRKMPALIDGDFALSDSSAIVHYLDALRPGSGLIPGDARERGRTIWFDEWADTLLGGVMAKMFFNRIVSPMFLKRPGDLEVAAIAERDELPVLLNYLDREADGKQYLVGDRLTLADIAVASPFANFGHLGCSLSPWPHAKTYIDAILSRPSFAPIIEREKAFFARQVEMANGDAVAVPAG